MYAGRIVETGAADAVLDRPLHPYTHGLIGSVPSRNLRGRSCAQIPGMTPSLLSLPPAAPSAPAARAPTPACEQEPRRPNRCPARRPRCFHPLRRRARMTRADHRIARRIQALRPDLRRGRAPRAFAVAPVRRRAEERGRAGGRHVDLAMERGEVVGLVGESGCGKSTLGRMVAGIMPPVGRRGAVKGNNIATLPPTQARDAKLKVQMIFQDPYASLNPRLRVADIVGEAPLVHGLVTRARTSTPIVDAQLRRAGLDPTYKRRYPAPVLRRAAPAHRHCARARGAAASSWSATRRSRRSMFRSRRRSSICSWTCARSSTSPTCSSATTSAWSSTCRTAC